MEKKVQKMEDLLSALSVVMDAVVFRNLFILVLRLKKKRESFNAEHDILQWIGILGRFSVLDIGIDDDKIVFHDMIGFSFNDKIA